MLLLQGSLYRQQFTIANIVVPLCQQRPMREECTGVKLRTISTLPPPGVHLQDELTHRVGFILVAYVWGSLLFLCPRLISFSFSLHVLIVSVQHLNMLYK